MMPKMGDANQKILDMKNAIKDAQADKIKILEARVKELETKCVELQASADENAKRFREQLEANFKSRATIAYRGVNGRIDP